jgi:hypothetical protein
MGDSVHSNPSSLGSNEEIPHLYRRNSAKDFNRYVKKYNQFLEEDEHSEMKSHLVCMEEGWDRTYAVLLSMWMASALNTDPELDSVFIVGPSIEVYINKDDIGQVYTRFERGIHNLTKTAKKTTTMLCNVTTFDSYGGHSMSIVVRYEPNTRLLFRLVDTSQVEELNWTLFALVKLAFETYQDTIPCELDLGLVRGIQVTGSCVMASAVYGILAVYPDYHLRKVAYHQDYHQLELFLNDFKTRIIPCMKKSFGRWPTWKTPDEIFNTIADCDDPSAFLALLKTLKRWNDFGDKMSWEEFASHDPVFIQMRMQTKSLLKRKKYLGVKRGTRKERTRTQEPWLAKYYNMRENIDKRGLEPLRWGYAQIRRKPMYMNTRLL